MKELAKEEVSIVEFGGPCGFRKGTQVYAIACRSR